MSISLLQSDTSPILPSEIVGIVNDYFECSLAPELCNPHFDFDCCSPSAPDQLYRVKHQYYSMLELYKVMCGGRPQTPPRSFIATEVIMRRIQLQTEQRADLAVIRCVRDYFLKLPLPGYRFITIDRGLCSCNRVSSYAQQIIPLIMSTEKFLDRDIRSHFIHPLCCQLSLESVESRFSAKDHASFHSLDDLERSLAHANAQHKPLSGLPTVRQRIVHFIKNGSLFIGGIGCFVFNTALKIALLIVLSSLSCFGSLRRLWNNVILLRFGMNNCLIPSSIKISMYDAVLQSRPYFPHIAIVSGVVIGMLASFPYLRQLWEVRQPILQLHIKSVPAFLRLWKDYTHTLGVLKGSRELFADVLWRNSTRPSVRRSPK